MAAGIAPIFFASVHNEFPHADGDGGTSGPIKTANTNLDGTGTLLTLFTGATNGSGVYLVLLRPNGTNVVTVARFFMYDGTNTQLIDEYSLGATTASPTQALPLYQWVPPQNLMRMQSGHKLKMTLGTGVAGGYFCSAFGGDF